MGDSRRRDWIRQLTQLRRCIAAVIAIGFAVAVGAPVSLAQSQEPQSAPSAHDEPNERASSHANEKAALFEELFGSSTNALPVSEYPVFVDNAEIGFITVDPGESGADWKLVDDAILGLLDPIITDDAFQQLKADLASRANDTASLEVVGIWGEFSHTQLRLDLYIPAEIRRNRTISLRRFGGGPGSVKADAEANAFAGAINLRSNFAVQEQWGEQAVDDSTAALAVDGFMNFGGFVLESGFFYNPKYDDIPRRRDITLTKDFEEAASRLILGETYVPAVGFQSGASVLGATFGREFSLQPFERVRPTGTRDIIIDNVSDVEVVVNGVRLREFRLSPGRYTLEDFPIRANAFNSVEINILDSFGAYDRIQFGTSFDFQLLAPGVSEFAFTGGAPITFLEGGERDYRYDDAFASGYYRRGITDTLTLGINAQGGDDQYLAGADAVWATKLGALHVSGAAATSAFTDTSYAVEAGYRVQLAPGLLNGFFDLTNTYLADEFAPPRFGGSSAPPTLSPDGREAIRTTAQYSQDLPLDVRGSIGASLQDFKEEPDVFTASGSLTRMFGRTSFSLSTQYADFGEDDELSVQVAMSIPFGQRASFNSTYNSIENTASIAATRSSVGGVGALSLAGGYSRSDINSGVFGGLTYQGNRYLGTLRQEFTGLTGDAVSSSLTTGSLETAIVFAGGDFAIARPVEDGFALVKPPESLEGATLYLDPTSRFQGEKLRFSAQTDRFGPAVLTDMTSYIPRVLSVEAENVPAGTSLDSASVTLYPKLRSGYSITVGSDNNVSVVGVINLDGTPFVQESGQLVSPTGERIVFFTNSVGRFYADNLQAGLGYRVIMRKGEYGHLDVPTNAIGLLRLDEPIELKDPDS